MEQTLARLYLDRVHHSPHVRVPVEFSPADGVRQDFIQANLPQEIRLNGRLELLPRLGIAKAFFWRNGVR